MNNISPQHRPTGFGTNAPSAQMTDPYEGSILFGESSDSLSQIHNPDVELVVWERSIEAELGRWLNKLPRRQLPNARVLVEEIGIDSAITAILDAAATPSCAMRDLLRDDVISLAKKFMTVMNSDLVDIRLETIRNNACWMFHRDCVAARMLTTYRGPGTEWVLPQHNQAALSAQKTYQGPIQHFPRFAVGLFKGSCAASASGIVHRSPPIAGTNTARLVLCLNLPSIASPELWRP